MTTEQLVDPDFDLLRQVITLDRRHEHYKRTVEVAKWATRMATGDDQDKMVTSLRIRETEEQQEQRTRITKSLTKYAVSQVRAMYAKLRRVEGIQTTIEAKDSQSDKVGKMLAAQKVYASRKSLAEWLFDRQEHYCFHDPNAYLVAERRIIKAIDGQAQGNKLYPLEIPAEDVVWLHWDERGEVDEIIVRVHNVEQTETDAGGFKETIHSNYYLYRAGVCVEAYSGPTTNRTDLDSYQKIVWKHKSNINSDWTTGGKSGDESGQGTKFTTPEDRVADHTYYLKKHDTGTTEVPAICVGSDLDPTTKGRTFLTPFHAADKILEDLINAKSEADLTRLLHVFPQKVQYAPNCDFKVKTKEGINKTCQGGYLDGTRRQEKCPQCKGSGLKTHTTQQEVIYVGWPKGTDQLIDLKKVAAYLTPDQWLAEFQEELLDRLLTRISKAIFNTDAFQKPTVANTATEVSIEYEKIYDRITSYASQYSAIWEHFVRTNADYFEIKGIEVRHAFPQDYKFESKTELLNQLKTAKDAGAGYDTIQAIERDLNSKLYQNQPGVVEEIEALNAMRPFQDLSPDQRMVTLASLPPTNPLRVSYEYAYLITQRIQNDPTYKSFAELPADKRQEIWDKQVEQVIAELPQGGATRTLFRVDPAGNPNAPAA